MDKVYSEWALQGDAVVVPSRELLVQAYRRAIEHGDLAKTFASVFVARAYVAGLNKRFGDDAYAVGMCTVPRDADDLVKHRMMFFWNVAVGYKGYMNERTARLQKGISDSLSRIMKKYVKVEK